MLLIDGVELVVCIPYSYKMLQNFNAVTDISDDDVDVSWTAHSQVA